MVATTNIIFILTPVFWAMFDPSFSLGPPGIYCSHFNNNLFKLPVMFAVAGLSPTCPCGRPRYPTVGGFCIRLHVQI